MNAVILHEKTEQQLDQIIATITRLYNKLELQYDKLDNTGLYDTSTLRLFLEHQRNTFDPECPQF